MLTLQLKVTGKTYRDIELGIEEALKHAVNEIRWARDSNDDGDYQYNITGDEESTITANEAEERFKQMDSETQEQTAIIYYTTVKGMTDAEAIDHYNKDEDYDATELENFFQWYANQLAGTESESSN